MLAAALRRGVLLVGCGASVVRVMLALNVTADEINEGLSVFPGALAAVA